MRELNLMEVNAVSGGADTFFESVGAMIIGALEGATTGMMKAGIAGGSTGGILGVGVVSALVGLILGGVLGLVQGGVYGLVNGWDNTIETFNNATKQWFDQNSPLPK
ncbi:hypothetical protein PMPD1_4342 [Paramixta manurensis]|uniref:DUF5862 domain-containing protein n=1 Tax=Paramixta manurensis TaxID=2740817 RepID=A0A6M8UJZ6_9GAMM|nr:hypothetical protein PMPD1_4342 [Erwiniaceae bacterium PD-1]